jgi:hypothetical protein
MRSHPELWQRKNWLLQHDNAQNATYRICVKNGRSAGNGAYAWKDAPSRVMVVSRPKVRF